MYLIDNIHALSDLGRRIDGIITKITDIINAVVRGGIDLQNIHAGAGINGKTSFTAIARITVYGGFAVYGLGKNFSTRGFSGSRRATKNIGVINLVIGNFPGKHRGNMLLSHNVIKG